MPTPESLIARAKSLLGWGADNEDRYQEWRDLTQAYLRLHDIQGITRPGKDQFDLAVTAAINRRGLPDAGRQLLRSESVSTRVTEAKELFRQLVSDCCKKLRETDKRRKIKQFHRNTDADAELEEDLPIEDSGHPIKTEERYTIRTAIINTTSETDLLTIGPPTASVYKWRGAKKTQLVVRRTLSLIALNDAIKGRYRTHAYKPRAIYGSLSKPPADGSCDEEDIVRITSDQELEDFLITAKDTYSPVWMQVQIHKSDGTPDATPPPDERRYFEASVFKPLDPAVDFYYAPENDSDAAAYFLATGKRKKRAWPRTDGGFEMSKYDARRRKSRWTKSLTVFKTKQRALVGPNVRIYDSDDDEFQWMLWLNPKTPDEWVRSRRAARLAVKERDDKTEAGETAENAERAGEVKAVAVWGKEPNPQTAKDLEYDDE
jgi:hypothetical protein